MSVRLAVVMDGLDWSSGCPLPVLATQHAVHSADHRFIYSLLDAVPPIHAESSHVATDKVPSM